MPMLYLAGLEFSYFVFLGVLPVRDVTASSIRNVATQPNDANTTMTHDHSGNR